MAYNPYEDDEAPVATRSPRQNRITPYLNGEPTGEASPPMPVGPMTPVQRRYHFENANNARKTADFANKAPMPVPDLSPPSINGSAKMPGTGAPLTDINPDRTRAENQARRSAFVGSQNRTADFLSSQVGPSFSSTDRAADANTRANNESAANVGLTDSRAKRTDYLTPYEGQVMGSQAGVNNAITNRSNTMLPVEKRAGELSNTRFEQETPAFIENVKLNPALFVQQHKDLQTRNKQYEERIKHLESQLRMQKPTLNPLTGEETQTQPIYPPQQNQQSQPPLPPSSGSSAAAQAAPAKPTAGAAPLTVGNTDASRPFPTAEQAQAIMAEAGNDPNKAAQIAQSRGFRVTR